jgi:hypothetical protein
VELRDIISYGLFGNDTPNAGALLENNFDNRPLAENAAVAALILGTYLFGQAKEGSVGGVQELG